MSLWDTLDMQPITAPATTGNPLKDLVAERLDRQGKNLNRLLRSHRRAGVGFRRIALDLYDRTGVRVSHTTVCRWVNELDRPDTATHTPRTAQH